MTASSVDTAELPQVRPWVAAAPVIDPPPLVATVPAPVLDRPAPVIDPPTPAPAALTPAPAAPTPGRAALRAERWHARRQRRLYALLGLSVLAATLAATVMVLDVIR